jgi:cephalosporin hydroxylase
MSPSNASSDNAAAEATEPIAEPATARSFATAFPKSFLAGYHAGTMNYTYRGIPCLKNPIDLALYIKLIFERKPATIVEIGAFKGGSALFFADISAAVGVNSRVISLDREPPPKELDERVQFIRGNAACLAMSPLNDMLPHLRHPWLVIEDSAHTCEVCQAVLDYFAPRMFPSDVIVMEDGSLDDLGWSETYGGGPNRALAALFEANPDMFRIMTEYTDFFGRNATYNPNAYLEKRPPPRW